MVVYNLNDFDEKEKYALLFGILLGDGCLSHYHSKDGKEGFAIAITGNIHDDQDFFEE
jgi:hypothetical protein